MSAPSPLTTLLMLTSDRVAAERLVERLRAAGLSARGLATARAERLRDLIARRAFDMILWWREEGDQDIESAIQEQSERWSEIPLLVFAREDPGSEDFAEAQRMGVRDLLWGLNEEQVIWTVRREASDLRRRRWTRELVAGLRLCERRARELMEAVPDGVALLRQGQHLDANAAYLRCFQSPGLDALRAVPASDFIDPDDRERFSDLLYQAERSEGSEPIRIDIRLGSGLAKGSVARVAAARALYDERPVVRLVIGASSIAATAPAPGNADAMRVGGVGRAALVAAIESRLGPERKVEHPFTVFFVRLVRHAELLRDLGLTHGLAIVDSFGPALSATVVEPHLIVRVSDEGFALLVEGLDRDGAELLGEQIRAEAHLPQRTASAARVGPDCEVGFYPVKGRAPVAEDILNAAHRLCVYRSATAPNGTVGMKTPTSLAARGKQTSVQGDSELAGKVMGALQRQRFKLVYQPIISLMGDNQENYSVLVRLVDETGELIEAKDFIGAAIRSGLIEQLDYWAVSAAIRILGEQRKAGHPLRFFLNLAEDTFRNPNIIVHICDRLRELDARGNWLAFQFQEELVMDNLAGLVKLAEALKQIKCRVAINRFGSTDQSATILTALPVDFVVFMPSFAERLADDPSKQERLASLARTARDLGIKTVVTGIEDARALTVLWTAGVDYVQGNFLQRPSATLEL